MQIVMKTKKVGIKAI